MLLIYEYTQFPLNVVNAYGYASVYYVHKTRHISYHSRLRHDKWSNGVSQNVANSKVWGGKIVFCAGGSSVMSPTPPTMLLPKLRRMVVLFNELMVASKSNFVLQKTLSLLISKLSPPNRDMLLLLFIFNFVGLKFDLIMELLPKFASKSSNWCFMIFFE